MSTQSTIYLDYASTTPVDPIVASKMMEFLTPEGEFGNPASRSHRFGWKADEAVEEARSHVANLVIWSRQFERFKRAVMNAKLLGVTGKLQREGEVIHLIAENLQDLTFYLSELPEQNQHQVERNKDTIKSCLLYTSPSPRD